MRGYSCATSNNTDSDNVAADLPIRTSNASTEGSPDVNIRAISSGSCQRDGTVLRHDDSNWDDDVRGSQTAGTLFPARWDRRWGYR